MGDTALKKLPPCPPRCHRHLGLSTSTSTFTGTCGFIHGKTCTNRSPVCRYPALKLPTSTGDNFGIVNLLVSTRAQLGTHLGARFSRCLKFAAHRSAPATSTPHCHHLTHCLTCPCLPALPARSSVTSHPSPSYTRRLVSLPHFTHRSCHRAELATE